MLLWLLGCQQETVSIYVTVDQEEAIESFVSLIEDDRLQVIVTDDPQQDVQRSRGVGFALSLSSEGNRDAYRITEIHAKKSDWLIEGDLLGVQYGLADALEGLNYRFYHPYQSFIPEVVELDVLDAQLSEIQGEWQNPDLEIRGLHLHTLHPIEGYYDFWEPSQQSGKRAKRVVDWMIKNRGNYIQWVGLDNIVDNPIAHETWKEHTAEIVDYVHQRGATVGLGIQLFGSGNLQKAFDLVDDLDGDRSQQIEERLQLVLDGIGFDVLELSFGEFFDEEPQAFIDSINQVYDVAQTVSPGVSMTSRLHVGDDLQVTYNNQEMIYYFLAAYANPEIVPWVHTVMYYNLFEATNGAYHHNDFTEHREFLFDRLVNGLPVAYFPESAYWVAFDNSVPLYLPMYVRSRWLDLYEIQQRSLNEHHPSLQQHVLFSSGWELGYWQNDVATLRMNWDIPDTYLTVFQELFSNYENGASLAQSLYELSEVQKRAMIDANLDAYSSGVDIIMEVGYSQEIVSQPKRYSFQELMTVELAEIQVLVDAFETYLTELQAIPFPTSIDAWQEEILDGVQIDIQRAKFMQLLLRAILQSRSGADVAQVLLDAETVLAQAQVIVDRRRANTWDSNAERLFMSGTNSTMYQYGYLTRASDLCYWHREMVLLQNALYQRSELAPGCGL